MREDLKILEKIDQYLSGQMSGTELNTFESEIQNNPALKSQVDNQQLIIQAAKRKVLSNQINAVANGGGGFFKFNWTLGIGLIFLLVAILTYTQLDLEKPDNGEDIELGVLSDPSIDDINDSSISKIEETILVDTSSDMLTESTVSTKRTIQPPFKEPEPATTSQSNFEFYDFNGLKCWVKPTIQTFEIDANITETIEGQNGTLVIIPENSFLDENGNQVNGKVIFELIEVYELSNMVLYNLTTTSNGNVLETGGMFYTNATQDGKQLTIDSNKPMMIQVPCVEEKPNMMAFESEIDTAGNINWKNPKPVEKFLTKVDMNLLDFLPTGFENEVHASMPIVGVENANDEVVDSLYYSFIWKDSYLITKNDLYLKKRKKDRHYGIQSKKELRYIEGKYKIMIPDFHPGCGINPKSIQILRESQSYANSFIATKEFEERLKELHKLENGQEMLDVYLKNLDKDLWFSDSIVSNSMTSLIEGSSTGSKLVLGSTSNVESENVFYRFYKERKTKVRDSDLYAKALTDYYNKKKNEHKNTWRNIRNKSKQQLDVDINSVVNVKESSKSTQSNPLTSVNVSRGKNYTIAWASFGWANIDQYLHMLTNDSKDCEVSCENGTGKGKVRLYQWLGVISTLTPIIVNQFKGIVRFPKEGQNGSLKMRSTYTMAISKTYDKWFFGITNYNPYQTDKIDVELEEIPFEVMRSRLKKYGGTTPLIDRLDKEKEELREYKLLKAIQEKENDFINKLAKICFLCYSDNYKGEYWRGNNSKDDGISNFNYLNQDPFYPGEEKAIQSYVNERFRFPFMYRKSITKTAFVVNVEIDYEGKVTNATIISGLSWRLDRKMEKALEKMDNWNPALSNGSRTNGNSTFTVYLPKN